MQRTRAALQAIAYHLPTAILGNEELAAGCPGWTAEKIQAKTGISQRHIAAPGECASDLAVLAGLELFQRHACAPQEIDYLLLCTQSPDYLLPTTACLLQERLGLPKRCGAIDFNLGCSGFVYGLGLAKGLIETEQAGTVLLITAETYSKHIHPGDRSVRTLFGDAAAAVLIRAVPSDRELIGPFVYGTDGRGADHLIVPAGGCRTPRQENAVSVADGNGNQRTINNLYMNGPEIFNFTLKVIPETVALLLEKARLTMADVDLFAFHQANQYMLEHLRRKLSIPEEKLPIRLQHCGNTVSSTIPILLRDLELAGQRKAGQRLLLLGFGVGFSWAGAMMEW